MSSFYGRKSDSFVKERRPTQPPKPSSSSRTSRERTTPIRAKSVKCSIPKKKVALQPRQEENVRSGHYQPGMRLTDINSPVPINMDYSSSDSDDSAQIGEDFHGELYSSDLDEPGSQQRTPSLPKQISSFSTEKNLMCMLQQQQALLQRVIDGQKRLEERQDSFEDQLTSLASKVEQPAPTTPSSSSSEGKRKRVVTRTLSNKVYAIHREFEEQFNPREMFSSDHNKRVQQAIIKEVISQPNCKFSESETKVAVKRCYENNRRTFLEQQSGKEEFAEQQSRRRKYRSRRERKFRRRTSVVTKGEMEKYWSKLSLAYVTEESDDPENPNGIIEHKLQWRSQKLSNFMAVLDDSLANSPQRQLPVGMVAKKVRKEGSPSSSLPPPDAPSWALQNPQTSNDNKENEPSQTD